MAYPTGRLTPVLSKSWAEPDSWTLDGYRRHGGYDALREALAMAARRRHPAGQGLRPARPRRRGLPDRHEVGLHPAGRRQAALPRRQRRRVRAGHLQGHPADDGRPALAHRGRHHRLVRDPRATTPSSTCAARCVHVLRRLQARRRRGVRRRLPRQEHPRLAASTSTWSCTPAPAPTSAARRPRCSTRSRAAAASRGCARRSPRSPASTPARRWSTTSSRSPACRPSCAAAPTGSTTMGTEKSTGFTLYSLSGPRAPTPASTRRRSASRCASCSSWPAACATGTTLKFWTPGGSSTPLLTAEHLDVPLDYEAVGAAGSMLGTKALQIFDETTCGGARGAALDGVLRARVVRQVHAVPRGHLLAGPDPASGSRRARAPRTTSTSCSTSATTSSAGRSAPSATARPARSPRRSSTSARSSSPT